MTLMLVDALLVIAVVCLVVMLLFCGIITLLEPWHDYFADKRYKREAAENERRWAADERAFQENEALEQMRFELAEENKHRRAAHQAYIARTPGWKG